MCQQICASGALLNSNPIRTTRQRRAHGDRHSSLLSRFEDALLTNNCACRRGATKLCSNPVRGAERSVPGSLPASAISVPEVRHSPEKLRFIQLNVLFLIDLADYTAVLLADIATFPSSRSAACRRYASSTSQKKDRRISKRACLLIYMCFSTTLPQPVCKASPMRRQRPYTPPCRQQCSSPQEGRDFPCMPVSSPCRQVSEHKELWRW